MWSSKLPLRVRLVSAFHAPFKIYHFGGRRTISLTPQMIPSESEDDGLLANAPF